MRKYTSKTELVRHGVTRYATTFLTLQRLHKQKNNLRKMFTSDDWLKSNTAKYPKGKRATDTVLMPSFWNDVIYSLKVMRPLVGVLRLVDNERRPAMGYIYEAMDRGKEAIQKSFNGNEDEYWDVFAIIDRRWDCQLHHPLHAAGHYLNLEYFYANPKIDDDAELIAGLYKCIDKLSANEEEVDKIHGQLEKYRSAEGLFGMNAAIRQMNKIAPAQWWKSYGAHVPNLRNLAVRVLGLTCSLSGCERNWSTFEHEVVKTICSWQYINCIDLWVTFISANIHDYDLQPLLYMVVQIINEVALLFPGPRYLPLRLRCIQWLNNLSGSSGVFIPVTSLVLDVLEYKITKDSGKPGKVLQPMSTTIKLPKHWLKSCGFQEECVSSAVELLTEHFAQWSYHISFPELATAPLIQLKKVFERTSVESFRRVIKRFIDQVELNIGFVQKRREEVPLSPKDPQSVESFLQVEKRNGNTPFTQYYKSIMSKASSRKSISNRKSPGKGKKKMQHPNGNFDVVATDS